MSHHAKRFIRSDEGMVVPIFAIGALPLISIVVSGLNLGLQTAKLADVNTVAETACSRATSAYFAAAPDTDRRDAAQIVLDQMLPATGVDLTNGSATASVRPNGVHVQINGELPALQTGLLGDLPVAVSLACDRVSGASSIIFFEDFENPTVASRGYTRWFVDPYFPNWNLIDGAGLQILEDGIAPGMNAYDGRQFAELAASTSRGGLPGEPKHSIISRTVNLAPGRYRLSYYYHANHTNLAPADQVINVYVDPDDGSPLMSNLAMSQNDATGWEQQIYEFDVGTAQDYRFTFAPQGSSQAFGGYLDAISLERVP